MGRTRLGLVLTLVMLGAWLVIASLSVPSASALAPESYSCSFDYGSSSDLEPFNGDSRTFHAGASGSCDAADGTHVLAGFEFQGYAHPQGCTGTTPLWAAGTVTATGDAGTLFTAQFSLEVNPHAPGPGGGTGRLHLDAGHEGYFRYGNYGFADIGYAPCTRTDPPYRPVTFEGQFKTACTNPPGPYSSDDGSPPDPYCPATDEEPWPVSGNPQDPPEVDPEGVQQVPSDPDYGPICCTDSTVTDAGSDPVFICNDSHLYPHLGVAWCDSHYRRGHRWGRALWYSDHTHHGGGLRGGTAPSTLFGCFRFWDINDGRAVKTVCRDNNAETGFLKHPRYHHWEGDAKHHGKKKWIWAGYFDDKSVTR